MIALKSFSNKDVGEIKEGKILSDRVLKCLDVRALKAAGFIGDIDDGVKPGDDVSFSTVEVKKKKVTKKKVTE